MNTTSQIYISIRVFSYTTLKQVKALPATIAEDLPDDYDTSIWPSPYYMSKQDLYVEIEDRDAPRWLCGNIQLIGEVRNPDGGDWAFLLAWKDGDNRCHESLIPKTDFLKDGDAAFYEFVKSGLRVSGARDTGKLIAEAFRGVKTSLRKTLVQNAGWHRVGKRPDFLWPASTQSGGLAPDSEILLPGLNTRQIDSRFAQVGTP